MNVLTVNYNTQELTEAMIRSLNKHSKAEVFVFDNSDKQPFVNRFDNVEVIDNTDGRIIDFGKWLDTFNKCPYVTNDYGSAKHCYSVHKCFDLIPGGFILVDSDILIRKDISPLWDERCMWSGEISYDEGHFINIPRLLPYLCYINVPMCKDKGVSYFNPMKTWKLTTRKPDRFYDTGAWFLEASLPCPHKEIAINDYMTHLGSGSWKNGGTEWLEENKDLWS